MIDKKRESMQKNGHMVGILDHIYVASHTYDSYNRRASSYLFKDIRFIHISEAWSW